MALELQAEILPKSDGPSAAAAVRERAARIRGELLSHIERRQHAAESLSNSVTLASSAEPNAQGLRSPSVISKVDPVYPDAARIAMYSCSVTLGVVVNTEGTWNI